MWTDESKGLHARPRADRGRLRQATAWSCSRIAVSLLLLALPALVQAQYTYTVAAGKVTITGYTGPGGAVTIPDLITGLPVTTIGDYAFYSALGPTSVTMGTNVTTIGNYAFESCTNLTQVTVPKTVTSIGAGAFESCDSLTNISVDASNLVYSSADGVLFNKSQTILIECPGGKPGSYPMPNTVTSIALSAFYYCHNLTGITLSTNVVSIGDYAFESCIGLTQVTLPKSVTSLGATIFNSCDHLTNITVDPLNPAFSSLTGVLFNQSQTALIEYPAGKAGSYTVPQSVTNIGNSAFSVCLGLTSVTLGTNVITLSDNAFSVCPALTNVAIGTNVTSLGNYAFYACSSLTAVTIPNKVASVGGNAFAGCSRLASATIGTGVTNIGTTAFGSCTNLTSVSLGTNVATIGTRAFAVCTTLASISIPRSVTSIGGAAFESCYSLMDITVDPLNSVYSSVDGVLFNKSQTTLIECPGGKPGSYTVPGSVTNIAASAFAYCTNLANVTIPNTVTNIGTRAFAACLSLKNVYCTGNAPIPGTTVFASATNGPVYYLPGTTGWLATFGGRPTALWLPQIQTSAANFGLRTNQFGFNLAWVSGRTVVVEACTNLASPAWFPLKTNALPAGSDYFSDPAWTNRGSCFYRLRWP